MPPSLFCGACFSYIIPPPRNSLSSGFWHLFPPDAEKQERPRENRKFGQTRQKGPLHSIPYSGPFCSPLFSFILNMSCFHLLSARPSPLPPASARQTKTHIDPQNKTHDACRQYHCAASFLLPYFAIYHLSDAIAACRKRQDHCPTCKLFCAGALQDSAASAILLTTLI